MRGVTFTSNGKEAIFGVGSKSSPAKNSDEYEVYLAIIGLVNDAVRNGKDKSFQGIGNMAGRYLNRRFFDGDYPIIQEHQEISGFPDLAVIRDDIVICLDHFFIDASEPIMRSGKNHGSSYMQFLGQQESGVLSSTRLLERQLDDSNIRFQAENLIMNLYTRLKDKNEKAPKYVSAVKKHIKATEGNKAENLNKPYEIWLLIVDITPTSIFPFADPKIIELFSSLTQINGVIYLHNPYPILCEDIINDLAFIRNDSVAKEHLKSG